MTFDFNDGMLDFRKRLNRAMTDEKYVSNIKTDPMTAMCRESIGLLSKTRAGRRWMKENIELWEREAETLAEQSGQMQEIVHICRETLAANDQPPTQGEDRVEPSNEELAS